MALGDCFDELFGPIRLRLLAQVLMSSWWRLEPAACICALLIGLGAAADLLMTHHLSKSQDSWRALSILHPPQPRLHWGLGSSPWIRILPFCCFETFSLCSSGWSWTPDRSLVGLETLPEKQKWEHAGNIKTEDWTKESQCEAQIRNNLAMNP